MTKMDILGGSYRIYMFIFKTPRGICLSICGSGLRDPVAYSLLGGGVLYPDHRLHWSLESVPIFRFLCFPL